MKYEDLTLEVTLKSITVKLVDDTEVVLNFDSPISHLYNKKRIKRLFDKGLVKELSKNF